MTVNTVPTATTAVDGIDTPAFLICSERCGSNLIRAIMNAHPLVYAPPPIHLARDFWLNIFRYGDLGRDENWHLLIHHVLHRFHHWPATLGFDLTEDELLDHVGDRNFKSVYRYIYLKGMRLAGKTRLFLKENHTHQQLSFLEAHFPKAQYVYQVRDPRDYVLSCKRVSRWYPHYDSLPKAIEVWREDQERSLNALYTLGPKRLFVQRYEDLLAEPEVVLRSLCGFLDIPFDPAMLSFHRTKEAKLAAERSPAYWRNLAKPLIADNVAKYRQGLSSSEILLVEQRLGNLMRQLDYPPETTDPGIVSRSAALLCGVVSQLRGFARRSALKAAQWLKRMFSRRTELPYTPDNSAVDQHEFIRRTELMRLKSCVEFPYHPESSNLDQTDPECPSVAGRT